jgi:RNA polymerase sigma-70 factor (ECF subfamily)
MGTSVEDLERLYRERYATFRDVAASVTGSRETARDAVQEAFVQALRRRHMFRGDGPLEAWVWRIVLRAAGEVRGRRGGLDRSASSESPDGVSGEAALFCPPYPLGDPELAEALRRLSPRRRLMVFLRYFADLSYDEIAVACAVSPGTVSASLTQARAQLCNILTSKEATK